jgi:hypothetical protein
MTPSNDEILTRDVLSGTLLIAGALAMMAVMVFHPTGGAITRENFPSQALLNVTVHSVGLAAVPTIFLGLLGLARWLGPSDLATAALVAYGFGAAAILPAAVASGFVATAVIEKIFNGPADARAVFQTLLTYTGLINQGFAKVNLVASSVAVLLFSAGIWRSGRMSRAAAAAGAVVGIGLLVPFLAGRLTLDTHGFGIVTFAQSLWLIWLGALLYRGESRA